MVSIGFLRNTVERLVPKVSPSLERLSLPGADAVVTTTKWRDTPLRTRMVGGGNADGNAEGDTATLGLE